MRRPLLLGAVLACVLAPAAQASNGRDATEPYPWAAFVRAEGDTFVCSGSLIAPRWVLTAAHCASAVIYGGPARPAEVAKITVGAHTPSDGTGETFGATRVIVHPEYSFTEDTPDLALIELDAAAKSQPLQIAGPGNEAAWVAGTIARSIGWGTDRDGGPAADTLRETDLRIERPAACDGLVDDESRQLCATQVVSGTGPCSGDSGGPLMVRSATGGYLHVGVLSTGQGECGGPGDNEFVRVAGDVMRTWIASYTPEAIAPPPPPPAIAPPPPLPPAVAPAAAAPKKKAAKRKRCKTKRKRGARKQRCRRARR